MKLSCSVFSAGRIPSLFAHLSKPICSSTKSSSTTFCPRKLKTPLFLRPPTYSTSLSDLKKWHDWAKKLASSIGNSFVDLDNGPDSSLLCRELKWLIEDSLEDPSLISQLGIENHSMDVRLRACLDELYVLWRQRIEERRPFQYIVGCEHWRDLVLSVEEGVLIPRPETELIVDLVKDVILNCGELKEGLWADLGTGSGAIAIDIGRILGNQGRVFATDISRVAVSVATDNVERYGLQVCEEIIITRDYCVVLASFSN
ncbi:release factor glutamine methyltransferase [Jatropha curcas]|uniref:release factor glutamine methyltransferase n=1 Tax=Jatropha curcas TaxID=180498 RepID=UPI001894516C|nr:release factor glutamine methyltransferase [Jatropha curcas]